MACKHENSHANPSIVVEQIFTEGRALVARRQCSCCNDTQEVRREPPAKLADKDVGIDVFYDWDLRSWEPISERPAYEAKQQAKLLPPAEEADPEEPTVLDTH